MKVRDFVPIPLLVLEVIGCVLLALGLAKSFEGIDVLPGSLTFEGYGLALVGAGVILIAPAMIHAIRKALAMKKARERDQPPRPL